jgi:hypothetical protein
MAYVIMEQETGGGDCDNVKGASGEISCLQFMPSTYHAYSLDVFGYIAPPTKINALYIASVKAEQWFKKGKVEKDILLAWNAGEGKKECSRGKNKKGVTYDSCAYVTKGLNLISKAYAR